MTPENEVYLKSSECQEILMNIHIDNQKNLKSLRSQYAELKKEYDHLVAAGKLQHEA